MASFDEFRDLLDQIKEQEKGLKRLKRKNKFSTLAICLLLVGVVLLIIRFFWVDSEFLLILGFALAAAGFIYLEYIY